jgi:hypothetical protein
LKLKFAVLALAVAQLAHATTIFDNGTPDFQNATASDPDSGFIAYDNFVLGGATTLRSVQWWGIYYSGNNAPADAFTINIFADNAGQPGSSLTGAMSVSPTRQLTSDTVLGLWNIYVYNATIPDTILGSGTYWVSIVNDTTGSVDNWFWATSAATGGSSWQNSGPRTIELAFNLSDTAVNTVPEPSSYLLSAAGLVGIFLARLRRA